MLSAVVIRALLPLVPGIPNWKRLGATCRVLRDAVLPKFREFRDLTVARRARADYLVDVASTKCRARSEVQPWLKAFAQEMVPTSAATVYRWSGVWTEGGMTLIGGLITHAPHSVGVYMSVSVPTVDGRATLTKKEHHSFCLEILCSQDATFDGTRYVRDDTGWARIPVFQLLAWNNIGPVSTAAPNVLFRVGILDQRLEAIVRRFNF